MSVSEPNLTDVAVVDCLHQAGRPPQAAVNLLRILQGDAETDRPMLSPQDDAGRGQGQT